MVVIVEVVGVGTITGEMLDDGSELEAGGGPKIGGGALRGILVVEAIVPVVRGVVGGDVWRSVAS